MIEQEATMKPTGSNSFKGRRSQSGRSVKLNEGLDKRLASYAAAASASEVGRRARSPQAVGVITRAAGAVGAGLLLSAAPASARIVYTPTYTKFCNSFAGCPPTLLLDLNHDGIADFKISIANPVHGTYRVVVSPAQAGNAVLGKIQGVLSSYGAPIICPVASALPAGHRIGPGSKFGMYPRMVWSTYQSSSAFPPFGYVCGYWGNVRGRFLGNVQGRFLGLEFTVGQEGQKHFGWARFNVNVTSYVAVTLTGYAYETEPNKPIRAGDTGPIADARVREMHSAPPAVATLPPATLGLLALGSRGLDIWRKEQ
jgi:hypothetical protein